MLFKSPRLPAPGAFGSRGAPGAAPGSMTSTFAPSRMRSTPSTITRSPACSPDEMAVFGPSEGPVWTVRTATVLSSFTT